MKLKQSVIVLLSGGIDSVTALHHAASKYGVVSAVSFDYGGKHNSREIPFAELNARRLGISHRTITLSFISETFRSDLLLSGGEIPKGHYRHESMKRTIVPFRNGILLSSAAGYADSIGASGIVIAAHRGDRAVYPDCREEFLVAMGGAIRLGTANKVKLVRPFINLSKAEIVKRGNRLGVNWNDTWSCYIGGQRHCGECGACVERREAFAIAFINDPTEYNATPSVAKAQRR